MTVRIVTDSTSDVPLDVIETHGVRVAPAYINVGQDSYVEGVDITRPEFYRRLPDFQPHPTTAAPASGVFAQIYEQLAAEGATEIISIHIASELSAYFNSARLGSEAVSVPVRLFDTHQLSMGSGWMVILAAEAAAAGATGVEIIALLNQRLEQVRLYAGLDTLQYLRRSGRVNWAQFGLGTLLRIKPIIQVLDGDVTISERVRTHGRLLKRIKSMVDEEGPFERLAILHTHSLATAEALRDELQPYFPLDVPQYIIEVTPAIGVHVGPGGIGFSCVLAGK